MIGRAPTTRLLPANSIYFIFNARHPRIPSTCRSLSYSTSRPSSATSSSPSSSTSLPTADIPALIGSAPKLDRHLIIHTNHDASSWPSHLESTSVLYKELGKRWAKHPQLSQLGFGMSDLGVRNGNTAELSEVKKWHSKTIPLKSLMRPHRKTTLYPEFIDIPKISLSSIESFENLFLSLSPSPEASTTNSARKDIYVCTHGSRDCRCGDIGEPLYQRLVDRAQRRDLGEDKLRIARVAHIGGHKWAGNALVYRQGAECECLGLLRDTDADEVIDYALRESPLTPWWTRWRGRLGIDPEEAKSLYRDAMAPGSSSEATRKKRKENVRDALGDPIKLKFVSWDGVDQYEVTAYEGESVMEAARRNDLPSILATCGGFCECATCHVHVDVEPEQVGWSEVTDEEEEQLDFAMGRKDDSRLGCQLRVTKELGDWAQGGGTIALLRF